MTNTFRKILARWPIVAVSTLLVAALAVATLPSPPAKPKGPMVYRAQVTLGPTSQASASTGSGSGSKSKTKTSTTAAVLSPQATKVLSHFLSLAQTPAVADQAAKIIGGKVTGKKLANQVSFVWNQKGDIIIKAKDHSAPKSAAIASAFANALVQVATSDQKTNQKDSEARIQKQLDQLASQIKKLTTAGPKAGAAPSTTTTTLAKKKKAGAGKSTPTTSPSSNVATPPQTDNVNSVSLHTALGLYGNLYHELLVIQTRNSGKAPLEIIGVKKPALDTPAKSKTIRKRYWLGGGFLLGALLGLVLAALLGLLDRSVTDERRAEELLGLPVLAYIPRGSPEKMRRARPLVVAEPVSPVAEAFRRLASALEQVPAHVIDPLGRAAQAPSETRVPEGGSRRTDGTRQVLGLAGVAPKAGCSTVAANLASILTESGFEPLVIDANLRSPALHQLLSVDRTPGIADGLDAPNAPVSASAPPVRVLPAGSAVPNPSVCLRRIATNLPEWRRQADLILIDLTDLSTANDAAIVAGEVDAIILVCARSALTPKRAPRLVRDAGRVGSPVLGVVLVEIPVGAFGALGQRIPRPWKRRVRSQVPPVAIPIETPDPTVQIPEPTIETAEPTTAMRESSIETPEPTVQIPAPTVQLPQTSVEDLDPDESESPTPPRGFGRIRRRFAKPASAVPEMAQPVDSEIDDVAVDRLPTTVAAPASIDVEPVEGTFADSHGSNGVAAAPAVNGAVLVADDTGEPDTSLDDPIDLNRIDERTEDARFRAFWDDS